MRKKKRISHRGTEDREKLERKLENRKRSEVNRGAFVFASSEFGWD